MKWLITVFGFLWIAEGITCLFWTRHFKLIVESTLPEIPIKSMGILVGLLGLGIVYSSHGCSMQIPIFVVGSIVLLKSLFLIFLPEKWIFKLIHWWISHIQEWVYKIWGIMMLALGVLFLYGR